MHPKDTVTIDFRGTGLSSCFCPVVSLTTSLGEPEAVEEVNVRMSGGLGQ